MRKEVYVTFAQTGADNRSQGPGELVISKGFISLHLPVNPWGENYSVKAFGNGMYQGVDERNPTISMKLAYIDEDTLVGIWIEDKDRYFILVEILE